jgi:hypothetical protein
MQVRRPADHPESADHPQQSETVVSMKMRDEYG